MTYDRESKPRTMDQRLIPADVYGLMTDGYDEPKHDYGNEEQITEMNLAPVGKYH
jgi:hypothetical protein